jgi:hypothetical protein
LVMLITITQAANRLGWHRTTVWRRAQSDPSFPTVVYIGPKSPRINSDELGYHRHTDPLKFLRVDSQYPRVLLGARLGIWSTRWGSRGTRPTRRLRLLFAHVFMVPVQMRSALSDASRGIDVPQYTSTRIRHTLM